MRYCLVGPKDQLSPNFWNFCQLFSTFATFFGNFWPLFVIVGNFFIFFGNPWPLRLSRPLKLMRLYNVKLISTDNSGTKRATGDPRVSKRPDFQGLFRFLNFLISVFLYFCIFWGFLAISRERKELLEIRRCQNDQIFEGFSDFQKN